MGFVPRIVLSLLVLASTFSWGQERTGFRAWIAGEEAGASDILRSRLPEGLRIETREWMEMARGAARVRQELRRSALRAPGGSIRFEWSQKVSQDPIEGKASWDPERPGIVRLEPAGGKAREIEVPKGALLWPGDLEDRLKAAARARTPVSLRSFSPEAESWDEMDLVCDGPDPLPGWPDAVRFRGRMKEGAMQLEVELWVSPRDGELRQSSLLLGLPVLIQRSELPPPQASSQPGFFERTVKQIPPHPFLPWLPDLLVGWTGAEAPTVPEDGQQRREGPRRLRLRRAAEPSPEEAKELPVATKAQAERGPFLAATPLVPYTDPVFEGVMFRLAAPPGASRWELARRVTSFVFDWITRKDYTVGFASAAEVCRNPVGDCTEHGVLAIALLRRLGVPARGAFGWVAAEDSLALHFWVEVELKGRWIPVDPTFDQAPASAFRVKLGTSDLANLASVGWDSAAQVFGTGQWLPEKEGEFPWGKGIYVAGDFVSGPAIGRLSLPGGIWRIENRRLRLEAFGTLHDVSAVIRPSQSQLQGGVRLASGSGGHQGWYLPAEKQLWVDLGERWIRIGALRQDQAAGILENFTFSSATRIP